jgi:hypothetical protein
VTCDGADNEGKCAISIHLSPLRVLFHDDIHPPGIDARCRLINGPPSSDSRAFPLVVTIKPA